MSIIIDIRYINILSSQLQNFKQVDRNLYNCRCNICGDSQKDKNKARGYFIKSLKNDGMFYKCHNCNIGASLGFYLKTYFPNLFTEYRKDMYIDKHGYAKPKKVDIDFKSKKKIKFKQNILKNVECVIDLPKDHIASIYCKNRKIPKDQLKNLYYTDNFKKWVNTWQQKFDKLENHDHRIIIPFKDNDDIITVQGRALNPNIDKAYKYLTIKKDDSKRPLFGINNIDFNKRVYIVEGPIDSLFLPNAIATANAALIVDRKYLDKMNDIVYVWDCEPNNSEIMKIIKKSIKQNKQISLWNYKGMKDLNEIAMNYPNVDIQRIIDKNIVSGLKAKFKIKHWKNK